MATTHTYRPGFFFVTTFAGSWLCWLISAVLATDKSREGLAVLFNFLGLLSPLVVAFIVVYGSGNPALKADFKDRWLNLRRLSPRFLLATLFVPPLVSGAALALSLLFGQSSEQFALAAPVGQLLPLIVLTLVLAPLMEEAGWRGYGMDSLRARQGVLGAALVFGVLWSLWHAPLVFIEGTYHYDLAHMESPWPLVNFFAGVVVVSVFVSWLYYKHNRSIVAGIVLHSMINASSILPAATQTTKGILTVLYALVGIAIILGDRQVFAEGPCNFVAES